MRLSLIMLPVAAQNCGLTGLQPYYDCLVVSDLPLTFL